uniref:Uncharacterized protein MANES_08G082000 n=1 Tax=Rhizophora mucronata TaxID=61149 RepID=A0A2P2IRX8_RHIMU
MALSIPSHYGSFSKTLSSSNTLFLSDLTLHFHSPPHNIYRETTTICMRGPPKIYPGGLSELRWKRMQVKKAKQLLKAGLSRERQIYEMRKKAELKAAVSQLERPWEGPQKAPKPFPVGADEQGKVLADRFQRPSGFDLWSEKDGTSLSETTDGISSAKFFPKRVVHSIKPYGRISGFGESDDEDDVSDLETEIEVESIDGSKRKSTPVNGKLRGGFYRKGKRDDFDSRSVFGESSAGESNIDARSRYMKGGKLRKNVG